MEKRKLSPEYREDYLRNLAAWAELGRTFHVTRLATNGDGSRTRLVLQVVGTLADGPRILSATPHLAYLLGEPLKKSGVQPWGVDVSSGGVNPCAIIADALARHAGVEYVRVDEA